MKIKCLFILMILASCQKEQKIAQTANLNDVENPKGIAVNTKAIEESSLLTDTILISENEETSKNSYILSHLLDQKADKDSIVTAKFRLDFYQNKNKIASSKLTIKGSDKGSEWSASYGLSSAEAKNNTSFIKISFGYPACGYTSNNYLYYLKNNDLQLVHEWYAMSDSGWGSWVEFTNPSAKSDPDFFYCKRVAFEPDDENDEMGFEKHSDSIAFQLKSNHWTKKFLSIEDKAYFEKKISFNKFHNQQ